MTTKPLDPERTAEVQAPNYTQIPNGLIGLMPQMKESELRVTLAIARETFGWHRDEKSLSLTRLRTLTGLSRQGVLNGIESGLRRRLIERRPEKDSFTYRLLVHEVDQSTQLTSPPSGPDRSTTLTTPVHEVDRQLVHEVDTANKERKKLRKIGRKERGAVPAPSDSSPGKRHADERSGHPAIQAVREILSAYPNKMTWDDIIQSLGEDFDKERLRLCAKEWSKRTKNMHNLAWLFEWYPEGVPQRNGGTNVNRDGQRYQSSRGNGEKGSLPGSARGGAVAKPCPAIGRAPGLPAVSESTMADSGERREALPLPSAKN